MRDLKFRAWDLEAKKMYSPLPIFTIPHWTEPMLSGDEIALMQFTGLKDKKGKEIYEGDVVKFYSERFMKTRNPDFGWVVWGNEGHPAFSVINDYNGHAYSLLLSSSTPGGAYEVIGNIYENPELLKLG